MNSEMLDTLLKFAAAGTSGVCVLGVAWAGLLLSRLPADAEQRRHFTLRFYMVLCLGTAIVSALAAWYSPSAARQRELENSVQTVTTEKREVEQKNRELEAKIRENEAKMQTIRAQVKILTGLIRTNPWIGATFGGALDVIDKAAE